MDQENNQIPFDPDFDTDSKQVSIQPTNISHRSAGVDVAGINPLMAFYAGLACSVLVFGLAGIIFLLTLIN